MVNENQIQSESKISEDEAKLQAAYQDMRHRREIVELLAALTTEQVKAISDLVSILLMTSDNEQRRPLLAAWFYSLSPELQEQMHTIFDRMIQ